MVDGKSKSEEATYLSLLPNAMENVGGKDGWQKNDTEWCAIAGHTALQVVV